MGVVEEGETVVFFLFSLRVYMIRPLVNHLRLFIIVQWQPSKKALSLTQHCVYTVLELKAEPPCYRAVQCQASN
jgi:hypothetical protein